MRQAAEAPRPWARLAGVVTRGWALPYLVLVAVAAVELLVKPGVSVIGYLVLVPLVASRVTAGRGPVLAAGTLALATGVALGFAHHPAFGAEQSIRLGVVLAGGLIALVNQGVYQREQSALGRAVDTIGLASSLVAGVEPEEAYVLLARSARTLYAADVAAVYRRYGDHMLAVAQDRAEPFPPLPGRLAERELPRAFERAAGRASAREADSAEAALLEARSLQSLLWLPLIDQAGEHGGTIAVAWRRRNPRMSAQERDATGRFADLGARAISGSERVRAQAEVLAQIQALLLSTPPPWAQGYHIGVRYESASSLAQLGGDFYDLIELDGQGLAFILADARGKGLEASSMAAVLKGAFRSLAGEGAGPARILTRLDRLVAREGGDEDFVTALAGQVYPGGRLVLASAGHPLPLGARPRLVQVTAPLGLGGRPIESQSLLGLGQRLICYTDGLIEARDDAGRFIDRALLERAAASGPLEQALDRLVEVVREHSSGRHDDDLALLGLEYDPEGAPGGPHTPGGAPG